MKTLALVAFVVLALPVSAQQQRPPAPPDRLPQPAQALLRPPAAGQVGVLPVQGNIYLLHRCEVIMVAQVGLEAVLLVDPGPAEWSVRIVAALRARFRGRPLCYIINPQLHVDHSGGNAAISKSFAPAG